MKEWLGLVLVVGALGALDVAAFVACGPPAYRPADLTAAQREADEQVRCIVEAGAASDPQAHARAHKCRCDDMARYPAGPQCQPDGGIQ